MPEAVSSPWKLCLSELNYDASEPAAVARVLESGWLTSGAEVLAFEAEFAASIGSKHAVALANGTAALHLALVAIELQAGDEVILPAVNFVAAANMIRAAGGVPVFAEIVSLELPVLDPDDVARKITPRTRAVIPMHYGGYVSQMATLVALCREHKLQLIEDACHAPGALDNGAEGTGLYAGTIGEIGCFSFFSNKNLATGEGGMLVTDSAEIAALVRQRRSHGMTTQTLDRHRGHAFSYDVPAIGFNYRMTEIAAALGRVQLSKLSSGNQLRRERTLLYRRLLAEALPEVVVPFASDESHGAHHLMTIVLPENLSRERVMLALRAQGIQSSIHYPATHWMSAYRQPNRSLPKSEAYSARTLTLPLHPRLSETDVALVVHSLATACLESK